MTSDQREWSRTRDELIDAVTFLGFPKELGDAMARDSMRKINRIMAIPIILILDLLKIVINLLIKAECRVAGVGFLLLTIFAILALVNKMWLQLGIFAIIFAVGAVILLISAHILFWIEEVRQLMD